jgi:hypothetical protein
MIWAFFDHSAQRTKNQTETKVDRILVVLRDEAERLAGFIRTLPLESE